jgi:cysteine desulfuration protein SufE
MNLQPIDFTKEQMLTLFTQHRGWEAKYRQLMLLGKQLPVQDQALRQNQYLVKGCESQVWLYHQQIEGQLRFYADSDARIVKGLLMVVLVLFNGLNQAQIQDCDVQGYFAQLDLLKHLSPSRSNGINAIIEQIRQIANQ